jgi:hypothetical protein
MARSPSITGIIGGGGSAYDVSPPAATTEATSSGVALSAKTFSAFTGADAGLIDGYTARTVNAAGSTSWSGTGLGAYTPSGGADGDAGVLALDATIGGVVVATALHDYSRAAAAGGGSLVSLLDWDGVTYDFLTTGGTGGSGGEGPHTVNGLTYNLSFVGTLGPTTMSISGGVLTYRGSASARGFLVADVGVDVSAVPFIVYCSVENVVRVSAAPFGLNVGESDYFNEANQGQMLVGSSSATNLLIRECTSNGPAFTTISNPTTLTDVTTTPTLMGMHVSSGSWMACYSQGSATLPTNGALFGTIPTTKWAEGNGASTRQDRPYIQMNCIEDADIRLSVLALELAP